jgi:hypothetical protein
MLWTFRIAKTKQADDDRIRPIYVMLERAGEVSQGLMGKTEFSLFPSQEISQQGSIIDGIDKRLDQVAHHPAWFEHLVC